MGLALVRLVRARLRFQKPYLGGVGFSKGYGRIGGGLSTSTVKN